MRSLALVLVLAAGCDSGKQPATVASAPASLADPLALMPADSDLVIHVDVAALRKTKYWAPYEPKLVQFIAPGLAGCGYDPLTEMSSVDVGIPMQSKLGMFVLRGLDRDKTIGCLKQSKADTNTTVTFDGDIITLTNKSGAVNLVTFPDAHTMVMQGSEHPTKDTLKLALGVGAPLRKDAAFMAVEKRVEPGAAVTLVFRPGSELLRERVSQQIGAAAKAAYAAIKVTDKLEWRFVLTVGSDQEAIAVTDRMQGQLAASKAYFERLEAKAQGADVVMDMALTDAQLHTIADMVGAMMARDK